MRTPHLTLAIVISLAQFGAVINAAPEVRAGETQSSKPPTTASVQPSHLLGRWYMGTMSGFDCNLSITSTSTLTVQYGGCFHQDPPIKTQWTLQGSKVHLQSKELHNSLGGALRIVRYKNHLVLVPERAKLEPGQNQYSYTRCFWRNLMKGGLQLSKDAPR